MHAPPTAPFCLGCASLAIGTSREGCGSCTACLTRVFYSALRSLGHKSSKVPLMVLRDLLVLGIRPGGTLASVASYDGGWTTRVIFRDLVFPDWEPLGPILRTIGNVRY